MVDGEWKMDKSKYDTDRLAQSSYGYSDEQLIKWMEMAEEKICSDQIPPASGSDFKRLEAERKRRERKPDFGNNTILPKLLLRVATVMAIFGSVLVLTGITAGSKQDCDYCGTDRNEINSYVMMNDKNIDETEEAFSRNQRGEAPYR